MDDVLGALASSHRRLKGILEGLSDEAAAGRSYDDEWNVGAVASHLGSGAQIFGLFLDAGLRGADTPGPDHFQPIWAEWNAKSPAEQVRDAIDADGEFMRQLASLSEQERSSWSLELFNGTQDLAGLVRMRLSEHALHTWDIEVAGDPAATIIADAVPDILTNLPTLVTRVGKPVPAPLTVDVRVTDPDQTVRLSVGTEGATMAFDPPDPPAPARVAMPAEALIRLVYGRLDPGHCPVGVSSDGIDLDQLRTVFPGV